MRFDWFGGHSFPRALGASLRVGFALLLSVGLNFSVEASPKTLSSRDRSFREFVDLLWPLAEERGVSRGTFDCAFAAVSFDPRIVENANEQAALRSRL